LKKIAKHIKLGKEGEKIAKQYLENKGISIIEVNWRFHHKEVDIICKNGTTLIFAEVKTRTCDYFQKPFEAVDEKKQQFLTEAAEAFVCNFTDFSEIRFDIVSIVFNNNKVRSIEHIKEAFIPGIDS